MSLLQLIINLVVYGLILAIVWWAVSQIPVPEPFQWVIKAVFALIVVVVLLSLIGAIGGLSVPPIRVG